MRIAGGVEMIELSIQGYVLHPTFVWNEKEAVLIDVGMPGQWEAIRMAMCKVGVSLDKVKAIILTHQDIDHIGSLPEILQAFSHQIDVYAHELDKPYIEGDLPLIKTDVSRMSKEEKEALPESMRTLYENPPKAKVNKILTDGEELPFCGGIQVIASPGHTPGHCSLYIKQSKTLVAGDAMVCAGGTLRGPVEQTTLDMDMAFQSVKKFLLFDIESVICYHGGLCNTNIQEQLVKLTAFA
ncbi:MBL fold metallo-hydrolase [Aneurinibacillus sp. REN35]|uniref:MBL fold metallo-hydrolase n=1 Tax=Aneurinibacillus sp. REN35 TaxID=3237286 RepID=UPI0035273154